jgi:hypothetical protein
LNDVVVTLDGRDVPMTLTRVDAPSIDDMRDGLGTIQLRAVGHLAALAAGARVLSFHTTHQPAASVYLVNALVPEDAGVAVVAQRRDRRQQAVHVEYRVGPRWSARLLWLLLGAAGLSALIVVRRQRDRRWFSRLAEATSRDSCAIVEIAPGLVRWRCPTACRRPFARPRR